MRLLNNLSCFLIGGFILLLISCLSFGQGDQPLVAVIDASPTSGPAPLSVVFDASRSTGDIITAYWDFGDGGYAYGKRVVHTYNVPGTYIVTLTVYDPARRSASASVTITVLQPSGQPPTLTLFEPQISGLTVTINGVTLPGTPGTTITRIHWIWGDGSEEDHWFPASHTYPKAGRYPIIVTSFQSDGLSTSKSLTVIVSQEETRPPVADFTYSPSNPKVNETIQFTDMSYDPDGYIISWSWDFGDGTTSTRQNPTHSYSTKGNYRVCLTVTDNTGAKNTACKTVTVEAAQEPTLEVIFRGIILVSRPIISFYSFDISIQTILYDPTGVLRVGNVIQVGGHRDGPAKVDPVTVGDLVEVRGVFVGPDGYGVALTEAWHYVKKIGTQGNLACFDLDYRGNPPNSDGNDPQSITVPPGTSLTLFFRYNEGNAGNQYVIRVYPEWDKNRFLANSDNDETISEVGAEIGGFRWDKERYTVPATPGTYKIRVVYNASARPPTWDWHDRLLAEGFITVQVSERPVKIRGIVIESPEPPRSWNVKITEILEDPTRQHYIGEIVGLLIDFSGGPRIDQVASGDYVEVYGEQYWEHISWIELKKPHHYLKKISGTTQGSLVMFDLDYKGYPPNSDGNDQIAITAAPGATLTLFFRYNEGNIGNQYVIRVYGEWDKNKVLANSDNDEQIGEVGVELGGYRWDKELYVAPTVPGTYKVRVLYSASATPPTWDRYDRLLAEGTVTVTAPKPGNLTVFDLDYRGSPPFSDGNDQNFVTVEPGKQLTLFFKYDEGNAGNEYIIRVYAEWDKNRVIARSGYDSSEVRKERGWSCWDEGPYVAPTVPGTYKVRVLYSASATPPTWDRYDRLLAEGTVKVQGPDLPELAITFCTLIDEYPSLGVIFEITNLGTQPSSNTTVDVWLNVKGSPIKVHTLSVPSLAPKATTRFSCRLRRQDWTVVSLEQRRLLISSEVVIRVDPNNVVNEIYKTNNEARLPFYGDNVRASKLHYQICYTYLQSVIAMITNPKKSQDYEKALEAAWNELVQDLGKEIIGVWASAFPQDPIAILIAKRPSEAVENIIEDFKKYCKNVLDAFNNKTLLTTAQNWGLAERLEDVLASYYDFIETFKDPKASQKDFLVSLTALAGTGGYAYGLLEALVQLAKTIRVPQWMKELENWFVKGFYSTIMNVYCKDWLFHCKECIPDACVEVHYQFMTSRQDAYDKYIKYISISSMAPQEYNMLSAEKTVEFIIEPNPITDVNTTTFKAVGPPFIEVAEIEVEVFDLLGRLLWKGKNWGNEIAWHTQDLTGTYLANGIYLCIIRCRIQDKWFQSSVLKVVILR